jgi:hypothetical protein
LGGAPPFRGRILTTCKKKRKMMVDVKIIGNKELQQLAVTVTQQFHAMMIAQFVFMS